MLNGAKFTVLDPLENVITSKNDCKAVFGGFVFCAVLYYKYTCVDCTAF